MVAPPVPKTAGALAARIRGHLVVRRLRQILGQAGTGGAVVAGAVTAGIVIGVAIAVAALVILSQLNSTQE